MAQNVSNAELEGAYAEWGALIQGWARRILRNSQDAYDVMIEVMLVIREKGRSLLELEGKVQQRAWLRRTTFNHCVSRIRQKRSEATRDGRLEYLQASTQSRDGAARDLLEKLMDQLDREERIFAVLYFEDGLTKDEIHQETGRSRPYINKKLDRISALLGRLEKGTQP